MHFFLLSFDDFLKKGLLKKEAILGSMALVMTLKELFLPFPHYYKPCPYKVVVGRCPI